MSIENLAGASTPDEPLERLAPAPAEPDALPAPSKPPSVDIHTPAEFAVEQGQLLPRDRYAPSAPAEHVHTVQKGETLFGLARKYYGNQRQWRRIYQANRNRIADPQRIKAGMKLIIP